MLVPLHEHGMQCPVEIVARPDTRHTHRFERIENRAGTNRQTGRTHHWKAHGTLHNAVFTGASLEDADFTNADLTGAIFGPPELMDAAARHFLKLKPDRNNPDAWRRLLIAADRNENLELAKQTLAYAEASRKQFGEDPGYASTNGDVLMKFKLENEAIALWQSGITIDPDHYEAASCASRLFGRIDAEFGCGGIDHPLHVIVRFRPAVAAIGAYR